MNRKKKTPTLGLMLWVVKGKEESEAGEVIEFEEGMLNLNADTE